MSSLQSRPKIVCLTGGIGAGKSTVGEVFNNLGIGVYNADETAKRLMQEDEPLKSSLTALLGQSTYDQDGELNRSWIAQRLFNDPELLNKWNALVHPVVAQDFEQWIRMQSGPYVIKEVAILFETAGQKKCDSCILVTAPEHIRIQRVMQRESWSHHQVLERIKHQWPDKKKIPLADYVIENLDLNILSQEVRRIHSALSQK